MDYKQKRICKYTLTDCVVLKGVQASRVRGRSSEAERAALDGVPAMGGLMGTVTISFVKSWSDGLQTVNEGVGPSF